MELDINQNFDYMLDKLDQINKQHVRLDEQEVLRNNKILHSVLEALFERMRSVDPRFAELNPQPHYRGSYFEGLRVGAPDEYDINLVLKMTLPAGTKTDANNCMAEYTTLVLPPGHRYENWCDKRGLLSADAIRRWWRSVFDKALNSLEKTNGSRVVRVAGSNYELRPSGSGPAVTAKLHAPRLQSPIDVDLVPCLRLPLSLVPKNSPVDTEKAKKYGETFFLVPKPQSNEAWWRIDFGEQEQVMINGKKWLKPSLRLIKLLRDKQNMNIPSYWIKTMYFWQVAKLKESVWSQSLPNLLMHMLKVLSNHLRQRHLPVYCCEKVNLAKQPGKMGVDTGRQWADRLDRIIKDIEVNGRANPQIIVAYFTGSR